MKLILIRHGKTEANEEHLYCGSTDLPLSEFGKAELMERKNTVIYPSLADFPYKKRRIHRNGFVPLLI